MLLLDWFHEGIAPDPAGRKRCVESHEDEKSSHSPRTALTIGIAVGFCIALLVFGWAMLLAGLLYVASDDSMANWLLTALLLAAGHGFLAIVCWRYAATVWREPGNPAHEEDRPHLR